MAQKNFNHMSDEQKTVLEQAIEVFTTKFGGSQNDYIEKVSQMFLMEQMKDGNPEFLVEIKEMEALTTRITKMMLNMVERIGLEKKENAEVHGEELSSLRLQIEDLIKENLDQKKRIIALEEESEGKAKEWSERQKYVDQLEAAAENNRDLLSNLKEKVSSLGELVAEYKAAYDERNSLREMLEKEEAKRAALESELQRNAELHKGEIERIQERSQVAHERELLALRTDFQNQITETNAKHTNELRDLFERMELSRKESEKQVELLRKQVDDLKAKNEQLRDSPGRKMDE